jgi:transposase
VKTISTTTWDATCPGLRRRAASPVDNQCGLLDRAGAPAFGGRPQKGETTGFGVAKAAVGAQDGEAIGRSRGGLSTKIHLAVDGRGRPLSILLTPEPAGDNPQLLPLLETIRVKPPGPGRARKRLDMLIAAKGYAHDPTRRELRRRRIRHTIPERRNRRLSDLARAIVDRSESV